MADHRLFGRQWSLTVGDRQWTDLRVVFEVQRSLTKHPDPAQITVYNLARQTRSGFYAGEQVRLVAGYSDAAGLVFSGTLTGLTPNRDGADYAVTLSCRDGDAAYRAACRSSYAKGAPLSLVVGDLVSAMGLSMGAGAKQLLAGKSTRGALATVGTGSDCLAKVLAPFGLGYILLDGNVVILATDGTTADDAILLAPDTGLVGNPEPITDKPLAPGRKAKRIRVTSLLQPGMVPGRRLQLQSVEYSGIYRIDAVQHKGDTHGEDWYSIAEVTQLQGAT